MQTSIQLPRVVRVTPVALIFFCVSAAAQTADTLSIVDGKIAGTGRQHAGSPATVRTVVDLLRGFYADAAITLIGVDDIVIDRLSLRLAPRSSSLHSALTALAEASGQFAVRAFGEKDFVLTADRFAPSRRQVEVFNLTPLLVTSRGTQLELQIREIESRLAATRKVMGHDNPGVAQMNTEIEVLKAQRGNIPPPVKTTKLLAEIEQAVQLTLQMLGSNEKSPEFSYHPGSNLLIVVGGDKAIEVTRKIVDAIAKAPL